MARIAALGVALLAVGALAGPTRYQSENKCATTCSESHSFNYEAGRTYKYDYSGDVETTVAGATEEASRLHLTSTVEITANSPCDFTMRLRSVSLQDSEPADASRRQPVENMATFQQELERFSVSFSYENGQVVSLCSNEADPTWAVNIKRGVLSLLNTVNSLEANDEHWRTEEDVAGSCLATYSVEEAGSSLLVTKTKDLVSCSDRGHLTSALQSTAYNTQSAVQSLPLLKSDLSCQQKVTDGRIVSVQCQETHLFRPFSQGENGAVTRSAVSLRETEVFIPRASFWGSDTQTADEQTVLSSLHFDYTEIHQQQRATRDVISQAVNLLQEMTAGTADDVRPQVPRLFSRLVHALRHLSERDLMSLNNQITAENTRRYFIDALPLAGSGPALSLMRQLIQQGDVDEKVSDKWMTSLAFVHDPTLAMVAAVAPLVSGEARRQTLLGVSSLVHHYCEKNSACAGDAAVQMVVSSLERLLVAGCRTRSEEEELNMLAALKALGNAGQLIDGRALRSCFQNENTMDVRLAAIRAYHRMPCSVIDESALIKTFENQHEDTEVRIAAYLATMQCPNTRIVDKVQEILSTEEVNQVSSFVWSHLISIQKTNDPNKQYMKSLLYNLNLSRKFSPDFRKWSRYFEKTFFSREMNAGATVDANVIFTPESYIPKSGMLNFTVDLFGQSINLLEIGGRVEGLEDFSESLFGNEGIYPHEAISTLMKTLQPRSNDAATYSTSRRISTPQASTYLKIFGNELKFNKYDSLKDLMDSMNCNGPLDFLQKLAKDMDWTENYQFLDSAYTLPTVVGFPFILKAEGTAALSIKTGGSFDIQSLTSMNIDGHIKPSAAISIRSEMRVDAFVAHAGLKMDTNLHTSTILDGHAIVESGKLVSVRVNMPRDKVEVLDVTTRFHSVHRNHNRNLNMNNGGDKFQVEVCSDKYIPTELLGINFCTDVMYTRATEAMPSCLLAGPMTARFVIEKTDSLKAFEFEYRHSDKSGVRKSSLVIDTPGSRKNRHISLEYMLDFERNAFKVGFKTPIKSADLSGNLDLDGSTKRAEASLNVDRRELFGFAGKLAIENNAVSLSFSPQLTVRGPDGDLISLDGGLIANKRKHKYSVHLTVGKLFVTPIVFRANINEEADAFRLQSSMQSYVLDASTDGTFRFRGGNILLSTITDYSFMDGERQTIQLAGKLGSEGREGGRLYKAFLDTKFSALPALNTEFNLEYLKSDTKCEAQLELTRGERIYRVTSLLSAADDKMVGKVGFVARHWNINFKLGGTVDFSEPSTMIIDLEGQLREDLYAKTNCALVYKCDGHNFKYSIGAGITLPSSKHSMEASVRREQTAGHLKLVGVRETPSARQELALVTLLELEDSQTGLELTLSVPGLPRMEASASLVLGVNGLYMARGLTQYGSFKYSAGGKFNQLENTAELVLEIPQRKYSAQGAFTTESGVKRIRTDLRFGRRVVAEAWMNTDSDFKNGNFEIFWNKDVDDTEKAILEATQRHNVFTATLKYPGNAAKLEATLFGNSVDANLEYMPGQIINVRMGVESPAPDNSRVYVSARTPIRHFRTLSLELIETTDPASGPFTFELMGMLEDKRAQLTGSATASFFHDHILKTDLELTTPIPGWERNKFSINYNFDHSSFSAYVTASKNEDVVSLGGAFELMRLRNLFKISTGLDIVLPVEAMRKGKIGFDLKMGDGQVDGGLLVFWKNTRDNELSLTLKNQYDFSGNLIFDTSIALVTPFHQLEKASVVTHFHLNPFNWPKNVDLSLTANEEQILYSALRMGDWQAGEFEFRCAGCSGFDLSYTIGTPKSTTQAVTATAHYGTKEFALTLTSDIQSDTVSAVSKKYIATLRIPFNTFKVIQRQTMDVNTLVGSQYVEMSWNDKKIITDIDVKVKMERDGLDRVTSVTATSYGKLQTPFEGWRTAHMSRTQKVAINGQSWDISSNTQVSKDEKLIELVQRVKIVDFMNWELSEEITSNTESLKRFTTSVQLSAKSAGSLKFTMNSDWDDRNAELTYSHTVPARRGDNLLDVTTTGKWYHGSAKSLHLNVMLGENSYNPTLTYTDAASTVTAHGTIALDQSRIFIDGLFENQVQLAATYNVMGPMKLIKLEYQHFRGELYSVDFKLRPDFSSQAVFEIGMNSPAECMGTASLHLEYLLNDNNQLSLGGELARNSWKTTLEGEMDSKMGHLKVTTPYEGFTEMSVSYTIPTAKTAELRLKRENRRILIIAEDQSNSNSLTYSLRANTPYSGFESLSLVYTMSSPNAFTIDYSRGRYASASFVTQYHFSGPQSYLSVKADSTIRGFATAELAFNYDLISQKAMVKFVKEGRAVEVSLDADVSLLNSMVNVEYRNTLLPGSEQLTISGEFDFRNCEKTIESALSIDNVQKVAFKTKAKLTMAESLLKLKVESPISFKKMEFEAGYELSLNQFEAKLEISKDEFEVKTKLEAEKTSKSGIIKLSATKTPYETNNALMLSAEYEEEEKSMTAKLTMQNDYNTQVILANIKKDDGTAKISIKTPFQGFEDLGAVLKLGEDGEKELAELVLNLNAKQIIATLNTELTWPRSSIEFQIETPFEDVSLLRFGLRYDLSSEQKHFFTGMTRNEEHFEVNMLTAFRYAAATALIEMQTPISGWEHVKFTAAYDLNKAEKIMDISYERNGIKKILASRGSIDSERAYIDLITPVEGYESMGISGQYVSKRGKREAGYETHVNGHRHRLYILYERQGLDSAKLKIETPIEGMHLIEANVRSQKFDDGVGYYINTNRDGKYSTAELRTVNDGNTVGVDVSIKSYMPGLENLRLTGSITYRGRKRSFSFQSTRGGEEAGISGQVVMKKKGGNGQLKATLPMIPGLEDADITFNYKLGATKSFTLTSVRSGVTRKFSGDLAYTKTSFEVNLNTPYKGFKKIHADASRSQENNGKVAASINLQRGPRKLSLSYDYLLQQDQGSAHLSASTPYAGFNSIESSLEYTFLEKSRSLSFTVRREARAWSISTSRNWGNGEDTANVEITSPLEELKELKISRSFNIADLANMRYDATYERNGKKFSLDGTGSIIQKGKKVNLDITLLTPLKVKKWTAVVNYDFLAPTGTIYAKFQAGNRYAKLDANVGKTAGSITLETTNPKLPRIESTYKVIITKVKRDIDVKFTLADGRQLSVSYESDFSKSNKANGELNVVSTTFGARKLTWEYANPDDDLTGSVAYNSPNGDFSGSLSVKGEAFKRRKIVLDTSINFPDIYVSTQKTTINYNIKNKTLFRVKVNYNGETYSAYFNAEAKNGKRIVTITYDGIKLKGIEIDGTWTIPTGVQGRKEFDIKYKRGAKKASATGFIDLGASGKSGSIDLSVASSLEEISNLVLKTSWDMVLPNRILKVDYSRNGRRFSIDFAGTRYEKNADYSVSASWPALEVAPGKSVSEFAASLSVDLRSGYILKYSQTKPTEMRAEFELNLGETVRKVKLAYFRNDQAGLVPLLPSNVDVEFSSTRTQRSVGPKIELKLKTGFPGFRSVTVTIDARTTGPSKSVTIDYKRGSKTAKVVGTYEGSATGGTFSFDANTPLEGLEQVSGSGSYVADHGKNYNLNIDYQRGQKYVRLTSGVKMELSETAGSVDLDFKLDSYITKPVDLAVTFDGSLVRTPRRSGSGEIKVIYNGSTYSLSYSVDRNEAGRRKTRLVVTTPLKAPFKKITYNGDVNLVSKKADFSVDYGRKRIGLGISWFAGEANQYGAELRLETPAEGFRSLELDVKATNRKDGKETTDLVLHYRRGETMIHVTGTYVPAAVDLDVSTPWGSGNLKLGMSTSDEGTKLMALTRFDKISGESEQIGAVLTLKLRGSKNMLVGIDIHTPLANWKRFNVQIGYTNVEGSNIVTVVFDSPVTSRVELSFELTNHTDSTKTDFRAGVTTNYFGKAFTFKTNILRDDYGMKYELEIESPFHIIPSFKVTGRR